MTTTSFYLLWKNEMYYIGGGFFLLFTLMHFDKKVVKLCELTAVDRIKTHKHKKKITNTNALTIVRADLLLLSFCLCFVFQAVIFGAN